MAQRGLSRVFTQLYRLPKRPDFGARESNIPGTKLGRNIEKLKKMRNRGNSRQFSASERASFAT
jgi:hypothetical protein